MKNLHVIPTDKPSRIYLIKSNNKLGITSNNPEFTENFGSGTQNQNIYITSDEEIKVNDYVLDDEQEVFQVLEINHTQGILRSDGFTYVIDVCQKIILTTDQDLIKDGVQSIDDEFLEWFVKNPSYEWVEIRYCKGVTMEGNPICKIIIPIETQDNIVKNYLGDELKKYENVKTIIFNKPEETKQETLEEFIIREGYPIGSQQEIWEDGVRNGAKWHQEQDKNKYSDEEVLRLLLNCPTNTEKETIEWFNQFKKK